MRGTLLFLAGVIAGTAITGGISARQAGDADTETKAALVAVKRGIVDGHTRKDRAQLDRLYADAYTAIDAAGTVRTKAQLLDALPTDADIVEGRYDLIAVRRWGDMAVASGRGHLVYRNPDGTSRVSDYYSFNVFEKRDGRWLYVSAFLP